MGSNDALFATIKQVSIDLDEIRKVQSEYLLKAVDSHFEIQTNYNQLAVQILETQIEIYTIWLATLQDTVSRHGLHRFTPAVVQDKPKKAA